ncbi:hypothetical protein FE236_03640 [Mariprofundus erugo]|uniref:OmpA-like domain-containing protein n=1 Tax=Mariprofundus erugo TaxID=2528639 RepID=A0A5R9GM03_9PROT|nr:hypothetical protein FEF65_08900 [Mariprofundus erugo]TLS77386.1 hypothetical protein FE236_03640 [Mariprofundus erugo]
MLPGCTTIDAFLFNANPDGTPIGAPAGTSAPVTDQPRLVAADLPAPGPAAEGAGPVAQSNARLRSEIAAMEGELKAVEDEIARLRATAPAEAVLPSPIPAAATPSVVLWVRLFFKSGQTVLDKDSQKALTDISGKFLANPGKRHIEVRGYCDDTPVGSGKKEKKTRHGLSSLEAVSQARADSAAAVMIKAGISASLIQARGMGATGFLADNDTPEGRDQNRRVDIYLIDDAEPEE